MNDILSNIMMPNDRDIVLDFLERLEHALHNMTIDLEAFMQKAPFNLHSVMSAYFGDAITSRDTESVRQKAKELKKELNSIPTSVITIAVNYDRATLLELYSKIRLLVGKKMLIEFKVDPTIIAGAIIEGNGRITKDTVRDYFNEKGAVNGF